MNFTKLGAILVLCVLCISYLEHVSVLAESSDDLMQDSERTLSSLDDEDEAESRTLTGYKKYGGYKHYGGHKKYGYGYKKYGYGYRNHYGRKLEGYKKKESGKSKGYCDCKPGYFKGKKAYSFYSTDPDVCCQTCFQKKYKYSSYDVKKNYCYCYKYGYFKNYYTDKYYACKYKYY